MLAPQSQIETSLSFLCSSGERTIPRSKRTSTRRSRRLGRATLTFTSVRALPSRLLPSGLDQVLLVHWPIALNHNGNHPVIPKTETGARDLYPQQTLEMTWKGMEAVLATGKVKAIGVCNASPSYLERILKVATVVPAVNQSSSSAFRSCPDGRNADHPSHSRAASLPPSALCRQVLPG